MRVAAPPHAWFHSPSGYIEAIRRQFKAIRATSKYYFTSDAKFHHGSITLPEDFEASTPEAEVEQMP